MLELLTILKLEVARIQDVMAGNKNNIPNFTK